MAGTTRPPTTWQERWVPTDSIDLPGSRGRLVRLPILQSGATTPSAGVIRWHFRSQEDVAEGARVYAARE